MNKKNRRTAEDHYSCTCGYFLLERIRIPFRKNDRMFDSQKRSRISSSASEKQPERYSASLERIPYL